MLIVPAMGAPIHTIFTDQRITSSGVIFFFTITSISNCKKHSPCLGGYCSFDLLRAGEVVHAFRSFDVIFVSVGFESLTPPTRAVQRGHWIIGFGHECHNTFLSTYVCGSRNTRIGFP